jgi:hypothetical protein
VDSAVGLVQAYLRVNGYFTVTEEPVFARVGGGGFTTATDLDILAVRFPGAGRPMVGNGRTRAFAPDPALKCPSDQGDMLIGEVKEGRAELNGPARDAGVLAAALVRFGCCSPDRADGLAQELIRQGQAGMAHGHQVRLVAFGSVVGGGPSPPYLRVGLGHLLGFLRRHLEEHWPTLGHTDLKDPSLGLLRLLAKAQRGAVRSRTARRVR